MKNIFETKICKGLAVSAVFVSALGFINGYHDVHATEAMTISISSDTLALNLAPNSLEGTFGKGNLNIDISLAVRGGYNLTITGSDNVGNLVGTNDNSHIISSISGTVTEENFSASANTQYNNKWGYKVEKNSVANNTFKSAPTTTADTIDTVSNFTGTNNYVMSLGARANTATPIDSYKADFVIAVVSTITCNSSATTIGEAICMQDMNDSVISSMVEGTQYRLMDNRDNKLYYIAKMKDGRVWMTQNLDLDLETTPNKVAALTSDNTNLTTAYATDGTTLLPGYSINGSTITFTPSVATSTNGSDWKTTTSGATNYNALPQSFDYGDWYYYTNTAGTNKTYSGDNARANCEAEHPDGTCDHYHAGNYYDWTAAVAMNTTNSTSYGGVDQNYYNTARFTAANSICPKGWRLPQGRTTETTTNVGYYSEANYTWLAENIASIYVTSSKSAIYPEDGHNRASNAPLYLARTGCKTSTSNPSNTGYDACYWTSTIYTNTAGYSAYLNGSTAPYPNYTHTRLSGLSVRCIATPSTNTGHTTITFNKNANDATGSMNTQTINANSFSSLTSNGFTRTGYAFNSWNTSADGSGTSYADAGTFYAKMGNDTTNVTLYAIWDKVWTVTFNTGSNVTNIIFDGNTYTNGQSVVVIDSKSYVVGGDYPTKYGFNSWTTTANGTLENSNAPTTNYTVTGDATLTLTGKEATTNMKTLTNPGSVSSTCKNDPVTPELVYDERDNEAYWVAVLCDGNYWMLDNLRLDLTDSNIIAGLSSTNTNATDTQLNYLKNGGGATNDRYATAGLSGSEWNSSYSYSVPMAATRFKDNVAPVVYGLGSGKTGVYYNYCATSAGTYCWGNGTSDTGSPTADPVANSYRDIEGDICPAGWRLPSGYTNNGTTRITDFGTLYAAYSGATGGRGPTLVNRFSVPMAGYYYYFNNSQDYLGEHGRYWTSTWNGKLHMYDIYANSSSLVSNAGNMRTNGQSIRCVLGSP